MLLEAPLCLLAFATSMFVYGGRCVIGVVDLFTDVDFGFNFGHLDVRFAVPTDLLLFPFVGTGGVARWLVQCIGRGFAIIGWCTK